ncbi:AAA family ATPase [Chlamydiota bacterium]
MRLKKLTIIGFKSFADRVVLDFDCEIIGIVGPNGCGKSNIVDAFRWVMGEQSAKSLRGDKMHDVLFSGTDKRKPLNYAEVSVWLTDINGQLPLPYDEITITRRLHRSGESEYFINKEPARLRDIQSLFLGSGIGKNAFSIFEQGKLDQIIHLSPLERRGIFDEAAGTSRFLQRKKETTRKLAAVTENYARVHDIHGEIEKQTRQLKKQAHQAKNFQENKQLLEQLEKDVLVFRLQNLVQQSEGLEERLKGLISVIQAGEKEIEQLEASLDKTKGRVLEEELLVKQAQKELSQCETKTGVLAVEIDQNKQRLLETKKREESVKLHLLELEKERTSHLQESAQKSLKLQSEAKTKEKLQHELDQKKEAYRVVDQEMDALREGVKKIQGEHLKRMQEEARLNAKLQEKTFRYEAHLARLQILNALEKTHEGTVKALNQQITLQRGKVEALTSQIDACKEALSQAEQELYSLRKELAGAQQEEQAFIRKITEAESHQKALKRLQEEMEGFSVAAKTLLKEAKNEKSPLAGKVEPLFEYLIPQKGFEELLASAMRPYAETLVVEAEEDLHLLLDFAKKKKIADFSVAIKSRFTAKKEKAKKGVLAEHVINNPVAYHFTQNYTLTDEGHFYDALDIFFHAGAAKKLSNPFQRQAELKALAETIATLNSQWESHRVKLHTLSEQMKNAEKRRTDSGETHRKKEMDLIQENFRLQQLLADFEKLKREIASVSKEKEDLHKIEEEEGEITRLKEMSLALKNDLSRLEASLQSQESLVEASQAGLKASAQLVQQAEAHFHNVRGEWQKLQQESQILEAKQQQNAAHEKKLNQEIEQMGGLLSSLLQAINSHEREVETSRRSLKGLQERVERGENTLAEVKKAVESAEKGLVQKRRGASLLDKERHELEIALAQESSERRGVAAELLERHGIASEQLKTLTVQLEMGLEGAMREIHRLRSSLESTGAVNLAAIAEFQETQERFDYLDKQLKDLEESKKDLEGIITTLDAESRKIFKQTFQKIRENFQKNFAILFTGGSADLTFTESSDILEAGIEIIAKPPGKQMRSISLLSGGEKCLTALALLFSVFEVRPAPFCILDEVDAPLDESNVERFMAVLKQFIDKTQFIIVTHNKKTMSIADLLIGVSMEEKGVSKLISLAFEQSTRSLSSVALL